MAKELYISEVKSLLIEFYNQLEFQKKLIINSTKSLKRSEQLFYVKKIQNEQINKLFQNNHLIVESYLEIFPKKILSESKFDIKSEMTKFNDFLFLGVCHKIGLMEQDLDFNPLKWVKWKRKNLQEQRISNLPQTPTTPRANVLNQTPQKKLPYAGNDFYTLDDMTFKNKWGKTKSQYSQETGVPMQSSAEERKKINAADAEYQQRLADSKTKNQPQKTTTTYKGIEVPTSQTSMSTDYLGKDAAMEKNLRGGQTADQAAEAARKQRVVKKIEGQGGIAAVMEGLREALFSAAGMAVQILLALTEVGGIANDIAWAILAIYDGYQYFFNNGGGKSLVNLIIDILCLATMGALSGVLGKVAGRVFATGEQFIAYLLKIPEIGPAIKGAFSTIKSGLGMITESLGTAAKYMENNMVLKWVVEVPKEIISLFSDMITWISKFIGETAEGIGQLAGFTSGAAAGLIKRAGVELSTKFELTALEGFERIAPEQIQKWVGQTFTESELAAVKKTVEENGKDKPTEEILKIIDSRFGTKMGDVFAIYISTKKLASKNTKYTSGIDAGVKTATTDVMRGKDPSSYKQSATNKLQSGLSGIGIK